MTGTVQSAQSGADIEYTLRMNSATGTEAARQLAQARWGSRKLDRMIGELRERADELGAPQVAQLQALVAEAGTTRQEQDR